MILTPISTEEFGIWIHDFLRLPRSLVNKQMINISAPNSLSVEEAECQASDASKEPELALKVKTGKHLWNHPEQRAHRLWNQREQGSNPHLLHVSP